MEECFVGFPDSRIIKATKVSLHNLIKNIQKKEPDIVVSEFDYSDGRRLFIRTTNKTLNTNFNVNLIIKQETECSLKLVEPIPTYVLTDQLQQVFRWMDTLNIDDLIELEVSPKSLRFILKKKVRILPTTESMDKLLLIDGSNALNRGYFATKKTMVKTSDGLYTNGVLAFIKTILKLIKFYRPTHLAVCWDHPDKNTFRKKIYPAYKDNRSETDPELKQQYSTTQQLLKSMNIKQYCDAEYEADDLIGTIARKWTEYNEDPCYFVSTDKDLHQLLKERAVQVISANNEYSNFTLTHFEKDYGITTDQWIDVKALLGDTSDNIPGVKGVGEKAAIPLIQNYGSIELLYEQLESLQDGPFKRYYNPLKEGKEEAFLSKQLSRIVTNVPSLAQINLKDLKMNIDKKSMFKAFQQLEFYQLLDQIQKGAYRAS